INAKTCDTIICLRHTPVELLRLCQELISIVVGVDTIMQHYRSKQLYGNSASSGKNSIGSNSVNPINENDFITLQQSLTESCPLKTTPSLSSVFP
ncbi:unnamed protein product, partial [Didymodactylos carnosus]